MEEAKNARLSGGRVVQTAMCRCSRVRRLVVIIFLFDARAEERHTDTRIWNQQSIFSPLLAVRSNHIFKVWTQKIQCWCKWQYTNLLTAAVDLCSLKAECACRDLRHLDLTTLTPLAPPPSVFPRRYAVPQRTICKEAEVVRALYTRVEPADRCVGGCLP